MTPPPPAPLTDSHDARLAALAADIPADLTTFFASLPEPTRLILACYYRPYKTEELPPGEQPLMTIEEISRILYAAQSLNRPIEHFLPDPFI